MLTSVAWLNRLLEPANLSPDEAEHVLTHVGFPIESREDLPNGYTRLDVELTSNRGDCLSHLGLAREIAAATGRRLKTPALKGLPKSSTAASSVTSVDNQAAASGCPRFTARVIRGVKIGPSPKWMQEALEAVGQRPINAVVDVTNYINFELGHPCHVFDLDALAGKRLVVRPAKPGETLTALDGRAHKLTPDELVVADAERAMSLAGVIGGLDSGVTEKTTNVLLEMATWDPVRVRKAARRLDIRTDASHRFERYVDAREIDYAAQRAAELLVECCGGEVLDGVVDARAELAPRMVVTMRAARCEHLLGIRIDPVEMKRLLEAIGVGVAIEGLGSGATLRCEIPAFRPDLTREVDLIEEVVRLHGFDHIRIAPSLDVHLELDHPVGWARRERAMAELTRTLTGAGYFETVTFSFATEEQARLFVGPGHRVLKVDEDRRKDTPFLRTSIVPSLLTCRRANQDAQVRPEGGVRLFECASVFSEVDDGKKFARQTVERRVLALLADAGTKHDAIQDSMRRVRGVIEGVARALGGAGASVSFEPCDASFVRAYEGETAASVRLNGNLCGMVSTVSRAGKAGVLAKWGLDESVVVAEIGLEALIALYPPASRVQPPARFPAIERDLSLVIDEPVEWAKLERVLADARDPRLERYDYIGVFRGKPIPVGKKSVTLRLTFRDAERTMRNEEIDGPVQTIVDRMGGALGATLRGPEG